MDDTDFEVGEVVVAKCSHAWNFTEGKEYTVIRYAPSMTDDLFTWPAYLTVKGDHDEPVTAHAHRFTKRGQTMADSLPKRLD